MCDTMASKKPRDTIAPSPVAYHDGPGAAVLDWPTGNAVADARSWVFVTMRANSHVEFLTHYLSRLPSIQFTSAAIVPNTAGWMRTTKLVFWDWTICIEKPIVSEPTAEHLRTLCEAWRSCLPRSRWLADVSCPNSIYFELLSRAFPGAPRVHWTRRPLDGACLSVANRRECYLRPDEAAIAYNLVGHEWRLAHMIGDHATVTMQYEDVFSLDLLESKLRSLLLQMGASVTDYHWDWFRVQARQHQMVQDENAELARELADRTVAWMAEFDPEMAECAASGQLRPPQRIMDEYVTPKYMHRPPPVTHLKEAFARRGARVEPTERRG